MILGGTWGGQLPMGLQATGFSPGNIRANSAICVKTGGFSARSPQCGTRQGKALSGRTPGPPVEARSSYRRFPGCSGSSSTAAAQRPCPQGARFAWSQGPRERGHWTGVGGWGVEGIDSVSSAEGVFHVLGTGAPHATPAAPFSPGLSCFHAI